HLHAARHGRLTARSAAARWPTVLHAIAAHGEHERVPLVRHDPLRLRVAEVAEVARVRVVVPAVDDEALALDSGHDVSGDGDAAHAVVEVDSRGAAAAVVAFPVELASRFGRDPGEQSNLRRRWWFLGG